MNPLEQLGLTSVDEDLVRLEALLTEAASLGLTPVTTEKDIVRLEPAYARKIAALPVIMRFEEPDRVAALLAEALARRRAAR